jgi:hypothetical protein
VRRAYQSNVDTPRGLATHTSNVPTLQHAKEPRLKISGQLCDFVQKKRPTVRLLEGSAVRLHCTRERAAFVPKELALDQLAGKPTAIERHERAILAPPTFVKRPRDVLFADARLATNQNGPRQARESIDLCHHGEHRARFDDDSGRRLAGAAPTHHAELRAADADHRARSKLVPAYAQAINPGPVGAVEVADRHAS